MLSGCEFSLASTFWPGLSGMREALPSGAATSCTKRSFHLLAVVAIRVSSSENRGSI